MTLPELRFEDPERIAHWLDHHSDDLSLVELAAIIANILDRLARVEGKANWKGEHAN